MKATSKWMIILTGILFFSLTACSDDDEDTRTAYVGTWNATDTYTAEGQNTITYSFNITKTFGDETRIQMGNFARNTGQTIQATVTGNSFTIAPQDVLVESHDIQISGSGTLEGNQLIYTYTLSFSDNPRNVSGTAVKR